MNNFKFPSSNNDLFDEDKLPIEKGFSTAIQVFFVRLLTILIPVISIIPFFMFVWLLSDYAVYLSGLLLVIISISFILLLTSLFRRETTSLDKKLKRVFDITFCTLSIFLFLPLFMIIGLLILVDSNGPIFHYQKRIGKDGNKFDLIKFRTTMLNANDVLDDYAKLDNQVDVNISKDPRLTRVGRVLKRMNLDELPQIFNILLGDMSLVGPRPLLPAELEKYGEEAFNYYKSVTPGMTSFATLNLAKIDNYGDLVKLDVYYVKNWSLWLDFHILAKTMMVVLEMEKNRF